MTRPSGAGVRLLVALVLVLAASGSQLGLQLATAGAAVARESAGSYAKSAFDATNAERRAAGEAVLRPQRCLQRAAVRHAKVMAAGERMFHQDVKKLLKQCGLTRAGENVAYGFPDGTSTVRDGWMKSPPHRVNLLHPAYRLMAVAARKGHNGLWYVCQLFGRA